MARRPVQVAEAIAHLAGDFFAREKAPGALMTITHADLSSSMKEATIYFSVLPATHEEETLKFAKRMRSELREYIKKHRFLHPIPTVDVEIDYGEKNRQRIDDLTRH